MMTIHIIHGPNLNLLGQRDHAHYGSLTLDELNARLLKWANERGVDCQVTQLNGEADIIAALHERNDAQGIVLNPAAYTHTSIAIRDAIEAISAPVVEVHLSHIHAREAFRHQSVVAPVCVGQISGLGWLSYALAIDYLVQKQKESDKNV